MFLGHYAEGIKGEVHSVFVLDDPLLKKMVA
jgi:hypothetical protein